MPLKDCVLVDDQASRELLFAALDSLSQTGGDGFYRDYRTERAALCKLDVIERLDGETAAFQYMESQVHHHRFRQLLIEEHVNRGNFTEAVALAREGLLLSRERGLPGLVNQYRQILLGIAQRSNDGGPYPAVMAKQPGYPLFRDAERANAVRGVARPARRTDPGRSA
jgi:hypothetical protein